MRYWAFVFVLSLISFGISGVIYFVRDFDYVVQGMESAQLEVGFQRIFDASRSQSLEFLFVGDMMLSRGVGAQMIRRDDFYYPFRRIALTLRGSDFVFGNLEGPVSSRGINQGSEYSFRADPRAIDGLRFAGFDVLSIANNHILDWGREAMFDTIDILEMNGIRAVGAGKDLEEANAPAILDVEGVSVAVFAYTNLYPWGLVAGEDYPGVSDFRLERILEDIRAIQDDVDLVVVSYHWGDEYVERSSEEQRALARAIIDAGADLIVGHHPHVVGELEKYKHGWIAYSLGNFVFDQNFSEETMQGVILRVLVRDGEVYMVEELRTRINPTYQVYIGE